MTDNRPDRSQAMTTTREAALEAVQKLANVEMNLSLEDWNCISSAILAALATPATEPQGLAHIVDYTNWRGETARRVIRPIRMWWGKTEWHPEEQWMLTAWDCEKDAIRNFAWQDMRPVQNPATSAAARPAPQPAADTRVVLDGLRSEHAEWSQAQFGNVSAIGPAKHLSKEAMEVASDPSDAIEHADCWMLLWDMQRRAGITDAQLAEAIATKLAINKARTWPAPKEGEAREHDRAIIGTATPAQPDKIAEAALVLVQIETDWFARGEDMGPMPGWWALKRLRALAGKGE